MRVFALLASLQYACLWYSIRQLGSQIIEAQNRSRVSHDLTPASSFGKAQKMHEERDISIITLVISGTQSAKYRVRIRHRSHLEKGHQHVSNISDPIWWKPA